MWKLGTSTSTGAGRLEAGLLGCWFPPAAVGIVRCWCRMAQFTRPCEKRVPGGRDRNRDGKSDIGLPYLAGHQSLISTAAVVLCNKLALSSSSSEIIEAQEHSWLLLPYPY